LVRSQKSRKIVTISKKSEKSNSTSAKPATIIWELNAVVLGNSVAYNFVPKHYHDVCDGVRMDTTVKHPSEVEVSFYLFISLFNVLHF
jgi:hypothetical protein